MILDGGPARVGVESTVLDMTGSRPRLLRPGGTPRERIEALIGEIAAGPAAAASDPPGFRSPGQLKSHYAPRTPLALLSRDEMLNLPADPAGARLFFDGPARDQWLARQKAGPAEKNHLRVLSERGDMTEAAAKLNPSFLLNVVMNAEGKIGWAVAGDWQEAYAAGRDIVDAADKIPIPELADLVVASACGYPKDINFYQSTKALFNGQDAVRPGGSIVILASCVEGYGDAEMQMMLQKFKNSDEREVELRREFTIAKYVGYCTGSAAERLDFHLVTDIEPSLLEGTGIEISRTLDEAMQKIYAKRGTDLKTWLMPQGANTLPVLSA
jgi:hypothetical protein